MKYNLFSRDANNSKVLSPAVISAVVMFALVSFNSTTVLLVNFNNDNVGYPPAATQSTGTVVLSPGAGVKVVSADGQHVHCLPAQSPVC